MNLKDFTVEQDQQFDNDIKFRNRANLANLKSAYESIYNTGYPTKFSRFLGKYNKNEFDTLARYYGANEPINPTTDFLARITPRLTIAFLLTVQL